MLPWQTGISQEDTVRALHEDGSRSRRPVGLWRVAPSSEDGVEALVFRLVESHSASAELLLLAVPEASANHAFLSACFFILQALEAHGQLIDCLAAAIIAAIGAMLPGMPRHFPQGFRFSPCVMLPASYSDLLILVVFAARLEMVVSLGNEAVSQRRSYSWSPPYGRREARPSITRVELPKHSGQDVPPPVFSFCSCLVKHRHCMEEDAADFFVHQVIGRAFGIYRCQAPSATASDHAARARHEAYIP